MKSIRPKSEFSILVEFPASPSGVVVSHGIRLWRVQPDSALEQITTCGGLTIYASAESAVWAELELYVDAWGQPIFDGPPLIGADHQVITGIFSADVAGIRSTTSYSRGYKSALIDTHQQVPTTPFKDTPDKVIEAKS